MVFFGIYNSKGIDGKNAGRGILSCWNSLNKTDGEFFQPVKGEYPEPGTVFHGAKTGYSYGDVTRTNVTVVYGIEYEISGLTQTYMLNTAGTNAIDEGFEVKKYLTSNGKYYLSDYAFRYAKVGTKNLDNDGVIENIVAMELLRRGYEVYVEMVIARTRNPEYQYEGVRIVDVADWLLKKF